MSKKQAMEKRISPLCFIGKLLLKVVGLVLIVVALLFGTLTLMEYNPEDVEEADIKPGTEAAEQEMAEAGSKIRLVTWNIGYGALGDNADFFMDGGENVMTADLDRVNDNMDGIISNLMQTEPDIMLLQGRRQFAAFAPP